MTFLLNSNDYTFSVSDGVIKADFQWYAFPFPFCLIIYIAMFSLAAYVILLAAMGIKALADKKKTQKKAELALR